MSSVVELLRARPRAVVLAVVAVGIAGCSSESTRFNENPFARDSRPGEVTGSVPQAAPSGRVEQSQLPPPGASRPIASAAPAAPATGIAGGGRGMASYQPATTPAAEVSGSVQAPRRPAPAANNVAAAPAATAPGTHIVAPGETLSKISRKYGKSIPELAKANNIEPHATLKIGDRILIPGTRTTGTPAAKNAAKVSQPLAPPAQKAQPAPKGQAAALKQPEQQAQQAAVITQTNETPPPTTSAVKTTEATPTFRWPVKGRVITGFGPKPNGQQNDGINLAVPEGTPVKAAEDGVVAYAGNELKGYGNLVLIRHSNGYVTAYAHAKELLVKRGDPIKRGQVIANSGQTGNVDAPQLHFEVRKGPAPMDPLPMLNGG